jgi:hypothetical protein
VDRKNFTFICYHVNDIYRVIKKSLCTWWLQYRKIQVMFKVSPLLTRLTRLYYTHTNAICYP